MSFTLCLNTSTIKPQPLLEKIRIAEAAGFAGVELWINDIYEYVGQGGEVRDVEQALQDHGLIVPCTIALRGWGEAVGREYELILEEARRRMELATRIGAPYVVATPPREPCEINQLVDRYGVLLEIGRAVGIKPTFEYISFFAGAQTLDVAWQVVQQVADDDATLIPDAFHTWNSPSTEGLLAEIPADRISHYHIDDGHPEIPRCQQTDPDRMMIGDGPIDLAAEIRLLREIGYQGTISLELFNAQLWQQDPLEVAQLGRQRLETLLNE
ncbi:MAG: sugar phosphate isomerase/epimerase [Pirellulaceae bacterium]